MHETPPKGSPSGKKPNCIAAILVAALGVPTLQGCASQAHLTISSDPPGAQLTQTGSWAASGQAPIVASYDKHALLNGTKDADGCFLLRGFDARWPSGAQASSGTMRICGSPTGNYVITIKSSNPNATEDQDYARRLEETQRQQQEAAAAEERRQAAIIQMAVQAALIPVAHNLAPKNQRTALTERLEANAATNGTLLVDQDGLQNALSNPTPGDAISGAQYQDGRILLSSNETTDNAAARRVTGIIDRLLPYLHHKSGPFTVRVLESNQVNAFTTGGQFVYVYTGLLNAVSNDDELAGILGHELAHIDAGHIGRSANQTGWMGLGALVAYATSGGNGRMLKEGFQAGRATFSREYESEADILGAVYAHRAGFSARGLANFFDRQAATNAGTQASPWLIDHPFDLDRRARVLDVAGSIEYGSAVSDPIATTALQTLNTVENQ